MDVLGAIKVQWMERNACVKTEPQQLNVQISHGRAVPNTALRFCSIALMQPSHTDPSSNPDDVSEQSIAAQRTFWRLPVLDFIKEVYHSVTRPPTPSPGMVSEGLHIESSDCVEYSREYRHRLSFTAVAQPVN